MKKTNDTGVPKFQSIEEEKIYWEEYGPLAEGRKGKINKPEARQKRSSFLAVRLTGEELTRLRDLAAKQGLGPSTFARIVLTSAIGHEARLPKIMTAEELDDALENILPKEVQDKAEALAKATVIGEPDNPALLIMDASQIEQAKNLMLSLIGALLSKAGVQVIEPTDEKYQELRDMLKART